MSLSEANFYESGHQFIESIYLKLLDKNVDCTSLKADHLCYRVGNINEYHQLKSLLSKWGVLLGEVLVNGRPIATFRLNNKFSWPLGSIELVELPAPKPNSPYTTGFEHIEFVISEDFENFSRKFPHLKFELGADKILNKELSLKLENHQVKFHFTALDRVIEIEDTKITDIIFDFDGTLIDSKENIYEINAKTFECLLGKQTTITEIKEKFAPEFSRLFSNFGIAEENILNAVQTWSEISQTYNFYLFPDVAKMLSTLSKMGYRLHIWTARDETSTLAIMKSLNLQSLWTSCIFWKKNLSKPDPRSFLGEKSDFNTHQTILIGDSATDMKAAKNLGAIAGAALWDPTADSNSLTAAGAELYLRKPQDVLDWLSR